MYMSISLYLPISLSPDLSTIEAALLLGLAEATGDLRPSETGL